MKWGDGRERVFGLPVKKGDLEFVDTYITGREMLFQIIKKHGKVSMRLWRLVEYNRRPNRQTNQFGKVDQNQSPITYRSSL